MGKEESIMNKQANLIINNKKNSNLILDLILKLEVDDVKLVLGATNCLAKVFTHFIKTNIIDITFFNNTNLVNNSSDNPNEKYIQWINVRFLNACTIWCNNLCNQDSVIRTKSMQVLMDMIKVLTKTSIENTRDVYSYPYKFIEKILISLVVPHYNSDNDHGDDSEDHEKSDKSKVTVDGGNDDDSIVIKRLLNSIDNFKEYTMFDDLRYFIMKVLSEDMFPKFKSTPVSLEILFALLKSLNMPKSSKSIIDDYELNNLFVPIVPTQTSPKYKNLKEHRKLFSKIWLDFLKMDLPKAMHKAILVMLHEEVMPHMVSPLQLTDYLIITSNAGGSRSLLALNGLFILMTTYNLEYPDFYGKLYSLLQPSIFFVQYRPRFMYLLDLFLSSTHLPANLVAAFIKKLSRLSLSAPSPSLPGIITLIINLIIRHPNCSCLIHRQVKGVNDDNDNVVGTTNDDGGCVVVSKEDTGSNLAVDPFDDNELNPLNTRAMESSLWEIKTLQHHYHHSISFRAKRIDLPLPKVELPYKEHLETTTTDLLEKERQKKIKTVATNYIAPNSFITTSLTEFLTIA